MDNFFGISNAILQFTVYNKLLWDCYTKQKEDAENFWTENETEAG
jgi:hypothetical protein